MLHIAKTAYKEALVIMSDLMTENYGFYEIEIKINSTFYEKKRVMSAVISTLRACNK